MTLYRLDRLEMSFGLKMAMSNLMTLFSIVPDGDSGSGSGVNTTTPSATTRTSPRRKNGNDNNTKRNTTDSHRGEPMNDRSVAEAQICKRLKENMTRKKSAEHHRQRLRQLIVDLDAPSFATTIHTRNTTISNNLATLSEEDDTNLNACQKAAIQSVLNAQDYAIIRGIVTTQNIQLLDGMSQDC